jgi:tetratricopeptide (TPR) repeat protein
MFRKWFRKNAKEQAGKQAKATQVIDGNQNIGVIGDDNEINVDVSNIQGIPWLPLLGGLVVLGALLGVILYFVAPRLASEMTGQFNVAVAEFRVQDKDGKRINDKDGKTLAGYLSQQIETQFEEIQLKETVPFEVWGPGQTGPIDGTTPEARAAAAEARAKQIHAHILVYGVIVSDGKNSKFQPEFYVNHSSFTDANEITGRHEMGNRLSITLPIKNSILAIENPALAARVKALDLITIGLAYYSIDDFEQALPYFEQAAAEKRWVRGGKEVVYLLIGNAYIRQASKTQDFSTLPLADQNYQAALAENGHYSRAMIGRANIVYIGASRDEKNCSASELDRASGLLDEALSEKDQPASANIETKVHFYRGQIAIIRDYCKLTGGDWLAEGEKEFTWVTGQYETRKQNDQGFEEIETIASKAYARLGYIAYQQGDPQAAIALFQKAIDIASPYDRGEFTATLGDIYGAIGEREQAIQAYDEAIDIANANGDPVSLDDYERRAKEVDGE